MNHHRGGISLCSGQLDMVTMIAQFPLHCPSSGRSKSGEPGRWDGQVDMFLETVALRWRRRHLPSLMDTELRLPLLVHRQGRIRFLDQEHMVTNHLSKNV